MSCDGVANSIDGRRKYYLVVSLHVPENETALPDRVLGCLNREGVGVVDLMEGAEKSAGAVAERHKDEVDMTMDV